MKNTSNVLSIRTSNTALDARTTRLEKENEILKARVKELAEALFEVNCECNEQREELDQIKENLSLVMMILKVKDAED